MNWLSAGKSFADEDTTEEEATAEYRGLAERRVRLGLVLSEIGQAANVEVTEQEMQRAIYDQVRQYRGQEQQIYDFFRNNPEAVAGLRAPIFEEKVVDKLLGDVKVTDKVVSKEELMADDEAPAAGGKAGQSQEGSGKEGQKGRRRVTCAFELNEEKAASRRLFH